MTTELQDQQCTCIDCKAAFVFTIGEQTFFAERNFTPPKRCKPCRDAKKQDKQRQEAQNDPGPAVTDNASFWREDDSRGGRGGYDNDRGNRRGRR